MSGFILLMGTDYYPQGWKDFKGKFDTIEQAKLYVIGNGGALYEWCEIVDISTLKLIESGEFTFPITVTPCAACDGSGGVTVYDSVMTGDGLRVASSRHQCLVCKGIGGHGVRGLTQWLFETPEIVTDEQ